MPRGAEVSIYADLQGFLKKKQPKTKQTETLFLSSLQKTNVDSWEKLALATVLFKIQLLR